MSVGSKSKAFRDRLALLVGTEEPFRWAKRMGIPSGTFARIWTAGSIPKHEHLSRIAENCDVSLDWLLLGKGDISLNFSTSGASKSALLPVIGLANCGLEQGWYNEEPLNCTIVVPSSLMEKDSFGVLCHGESMVPAGIPNGSLSIIHPNREPSVGKPALIRTKSFIKGKEVLLSTVKRFEGIEGETIKLSGWLNADENGEQSIFYEKRILSSITLIAPVATVLDNAGLILPPEEANQSASTLDESLLKECFEALSPLLASMESDKFTELFLLIYKEGLKSGKMDMDIVKKCVAIIGGKS